MEATKKLVIGDPFDKKTDMGALISKQHYEKVTSYIELAKKDGGVILCGGDKPANLAAHNADGYFLNPTVITNIGPSSRVFMDEIFGPVVTITKFKTEEEGSHPSFTFLFAINDY